MIRALEIEPAKVSLVSRDVPRTRNRRGGVKCLTVKAYIPKLVQKRQECCATNICSSHQSWTELRVYDIRRVLRQKFLSAHDDFRIMTLRVDFQHCYVCLAQNILPKIIQGVDVHIDSLCVKTLPRYPRRWLVDCVLLRVWPVDPELSLAIRQCQRHGKKGYFAPRFCSFVSKTRFLVRAGFDSPQMISVFQQIRPLLTLMGADF
mmetsp:Transcript_80657/g.261420  ORF Transcript_80657/g.261420 Transcript_80657/m.261420 type:complete len:205 (+) Transcript_80657:358-972(+)